MFNIGTGEMILIAVVALLVLGPTRLPELARGIGKFVREFRRQTDDVRGVVEREFYRMDEELVRAAPDAVPQMSEGEAHEPAPADTTPEEISEHHPDAEVAAADSESAGPAHQEGTEEPHTTKSETSVQSADSDSLGGRST